MVFGRRPIARPTSKPGRDSDSLDVNARKLSPLHLVVFYQLCSVDFEREGTIVVAIIFGEGVERHSEAEFRPRPLLEKEREPFQRDPCTIIA